MKKITAGILAILGAVLLAAGIYVGTGHSYAVSVIGGADGPTSVFIAGKVSEGASAAMVLAGAVILFVLLYLLVKKIREK